MENEEIFRQNELKTPDGLTKKVQEKPISVVDKRNSNIESNFDLDNFMQDIGTFISPNNFDESMGSGKYGQLLRFATADSDGFKKSIEESKAIAISIENNGGTLLEKTKNLTTVRIYAIYEDGTGNETKLYFLPNGEYYNSNFYPQIKIPENFKIDISNVKEIDTTEDGDK